MKQPAPAAVLIEIRHVLPLLESIRPAMRHEISSTTRGKGGAHMARFYGALTLALLVSLGGSVWAVDGVVDINQARALVGGVSAGDTPGFPVTISQSGSYRLTGNLTVPDANTTAVSITADSVTIDLNGFAVQGPVVCIGQPVTSCSPTGSGIGIDGGGHSGLTVRNGVIRGMGGDGAPLGTASRFENVTAQSNGGNGLFSNAGGPGPSSATVTGCITESNGISGISLVGGSIYNSLAKFNRFDGIGADTITASSAEANGRFGISGLSVLGCMANLNGGDGIKAPVGAVANSEAGGNSGRGIVAATATGGFANGNSVSPQILATGITGHNICGVTPCP